MSESCIFCKIANGDIPSEIVYEDDQVLAFKDLSPQAPTHLLVIPRKHLATLNDVESSDRALIGHMFLTATKLATDSGLAEPGYRIVMNCNQEGGQTVFHIHLHLLGGRQLTRLG